MEPERAQLDPSSPARSRRGLLALELALALVAYRGLLDPRAPDSLSRELERWFFVPGRTAGAALLVLPPALWLLWRRWGRLRALPAPTGPAARVAGGLLCLAGLAALAWARFTAAPELLVVSLALVGLGLAAVLRGAAGARAVALPALFLGFALPMPAPLLNEVAFRLQLWTAEYAGWLLYAVGVPALVSADQISRESVRFVVIENCSGLRSIETLSMLALLMADLFRRPPAHALLLVLAAPPIAFALNGVRVLALILNPHSDVVTIHNAQGVAILLAGLVLLYLLDGGLERVRGGRPVSGPGPGAPVAATRLSGTARGAPALVLAAAAILSFAVPTWQATYPGRPGVHVWIPARLGDWRSVDLEIDRTFLGTIALRESLLRRYRSGGRSVDLFVGVGSHAPRVRGPFSPKTAVPGSGWIVEDAWPVALGTRRATARLCRRGAERRLVLHWYEGWGGLLPEVGRSLLALDQSPWRRRRDGLVVRLETPLAGTGEEPRRRAERRLEAFFESLEGRLEDLELLDTRKSFSGFSGTGKIISASNGPR